MTQSEIRGLKSGRFFSEDGSAVIKICRSDECVIIEIADKESDSVYKFDIAFDAKNDSVVPFEFMSLTEQRTLEQEL